MGKPLHWVVLILFLLAPRLAAATGAQDPAAAAALFEAGRAAMAEGRYDEACLKFTESHRYDPNAVGTVLNLALCNEELGKVATASAHYAWALQRFPAGDERIAVARERKAAVDERVAHLTLSAPSSEQANVVVLRDGIAVGQGTFGVALPVDPGRHEVVVQASGHSDRHYAVDLAERERLTLELELGPARAVTAPAPPIRSPSPEKAEPKPGPNTLAYVAGGVGVLGVGVGAITGLMAIGKSGTVEDHCDLETRTCATEEAIDAASAGSSLATISTVSFVVGGLGLGAGAYLILTSGDDGPTTTAVARATPGGAAFEIAGRF